MRKCLVFFVIVLAVFWAAPAYVSADVGPKESVVLTFKGEKRRDTFYVTLLSRGRQLSMGPYLPVSSQEENRYRPGDGEYEIWEKFASYRAPEGFYFRQYFKLCTQDVFEWPAYPPEEFKILLYFPEEDTFALSGGTYKVYAFSSYYSVDLDNVDLSEDTIIGKSQVSESYDYTWEIFSLAVRVVLTILLEVLIGILFGYRGKRQLQVILTANVATQLLLNILLNLANYYRGALSFVLNYIWLEVVVISVEALWYRRYLPSESLWVLYSKDDEILARKSRVRPVLYAVLANLFSFAAGLVLAYWVPGIF